MGVKTPIPPASERTAIFAVIVKDTAVLNLSISRLEGEIELLREYSTRHTADIVTGKLDVRTAAEALPEPSFSSDFSDLSDWSDNSDILQEEPDLEYAQ